jgi:hypothetical protein
MVRFQADADSNQVILTALVRRSPTIDFRSADSAQAAASAEEWTNRICYLPL